jgi:hypothetical protein
MRLDGVANVTLIMNLMISRDDVVGLGRWTWAMARFARPPPTPRPAVSASAAPPHLRLRCVPSWL